MDRAVRNKKRPGSQVSKLKPKTFARKIKRKPAGTHTQILYRYTSPKTGQLEQVVGYQSSVTSHRATW